MTHCVILLAMLAQALPVSPTGRPTPNAVNVQVDPAHPMPITGTISASSSVHSTTAVPTYVDGTDNPFSSDLTGSLRVICMGGTCGGASPFGDNTAFTAGTTSVSVIAGVFNDSITALTSGRAGAPRLTSFRAMHLNMRDASGNEIPFPAALAASGGMKVDVQNASIAVTGTFWQATQPVSGTFWQATQPVSGTVTVSNPFALDATLTGGSQKAIVRGGAKGATTAADVTSTPNGADHQGLDVAVQGTVTVSGTVTTTPPSNASTNVVQFGSNNVVTGTGASGVGIPRVTVANDSNILATQSGTWSVNQSGSWTVDLSDRAARLLGVVYGSQGQQLKQTATNFNLQSELAVGGTLIDPRAIRALTASDSVTVVQGIGTNLHVVCDSGCTPGGSFADGSAFTAGSTAVNVSGGVYNEGLADVASGTAASPRITAKRAFHTNLRDSNGNEIASMGAAQTPQAKDQAIVVSLSPNSPTINVNVVSKTQVLGARPQTYRQVDLDGHSPQILAPNKQAQTVDTSIVTAPSPTPTIVCPLTVGISQTTSTRLVVGQTGKRIYICGVFVVSTTAQSVSLVEGTGTTCASAPQAALDGSLTVANGVPLAANGGWVKGSDRPLRVSQNNGTDICLLQSGAGLVAGSIDYAVY